ncbi:MAG: tetratricopeptide repeat protein, partial [Deltaproteobacteria bacterium]
MYFRLIITLLLTIFLEHSSFSAPTMPLKEQSLKEFAEAFKVKNYIVARDNALKSPDSPTRNFMLGVASYRLENWEDTVKYLAKSVDDFELLADYTLYYRADALSRLSRYEESLALLDKLKRNYPASRFLRGANSLYADNLFNKKEYQRALDASQSFIETYPSGADALRASLQATLSREALGNKQRAVSELRNIWLNHPGSPVAVAAEANLQRLKAEQITVPPYTAEELLKRGNILYSLGKYSQAMETLNAVSRQTMTGKMKTRLDFKSAQALFKSREYRKAEHLFAELAEGADREISTEATYWLARTQEKRGLEDRAVATYLKLAEGFPGSELADDALLQAALSRRGHGDKSAAVSLLDRLLDRYPSSTLKPRALWEKSWARYLSRDFRGASESLKRLLDNASYREKALYWLGKSEEASGERERSNAAFKLLREEYPFGFYSLHFRKEAGLRIGLLPALDSASVSSIPLPSGYKRVKALISFGMFNEARMELAAVRIKGASSSRFLDLARLYWEISDYNWSPDSRWVCYSLVQPNRNSQIFVYNVETGKRSAVTDDFYDNLYPGFDANGKYLYFVSSRNFDLQMDFYEDNHVVSAPQQVMAVQLHAGEAPPFADAAPAAKNGAEKAAGERPSAEKSQPEKPASGKMAAVEPMTIDLD